MTVTEIHTYICSKTQLSQAGIPHNFEINTVLIFKMFIFQAKLLCFGTSSQIEIGLQHKVHSIALRKFHGTSINKPNYLLFFWSKPVSFEEPFDKE